jgi:acylpyruvate hydrolase
MKLLTFSHAGNTTFGAKVDGWILDLPKVAASTQALNSFPKQMLDFISDADRHLPVAKHTVDHVVASEGFEILQKMKIAYKEEEVFFLPPIASPQKIICLGMNYRKHAQEMGREPPKYPTLFGKFAHTLIGHKNPIQLPEISDQVDYEAELAIVIGKTGKSIKAEDAFKHIAGYTILNDVSVRDFQNRTLQWLQGKNFDRSCPVGPYLVTKDEVPNPDALEIELRLNGTVMQHSNTSDFIFSVPETIEYISQIMTLEPGDIISTGTPSGVGVARDPQVFLKAGDLVEIELQGVGRLENPVVAAEKRS